MLPSSHRTLAKMCKGMRDQQNSLVEHVPQVCRVQAALDEKLNTGFRAQSESMKALRHWVPDLSLMLKRGGGTWALGRGAE